MRKSPRTYDDDFIITLLKELDKGRTVSEVADIYDVDPVSIYKWRRLAKQGKFGAYRPEFVPATVKRYPLELKLAAAKRVAAGETCSSVAVDLKVGRSSVSDWYTAFGPKNKPVVKQVGKAEAKCASAK